MSRANRSYSLYDGDVPLSARDLEDAHSRDGEPPMLRWHNAGEWIKAFLDYHQPLQARTKQQLCIALVVFVVQSVALSIYILVLTGYGIAHEAKDPAYPGQTEFAACRDMAMFNLLWIVRLPFVAYVLLKMYETPRGHDASLHLKLEATYYFFTLILWTIFQMRWIGREAHCQATAPHIAKLSFVLSLIASAWLTISQTAIFLPARHLSLPSPSCIVPYSEVTNNSSPLERPEFPQRAVSEGMELVSATVRPNSPTSTFYLSSTSRDVIKYTQCNYVPDII
ncbi:hypothetical protein C8Q78DRAFT_415169 [Trametes maxima]|nr:hypothetical protein C8Q78DRAFT_415169 [Trametes maxima]